MTETAFPLDTVLAWKDVGGGVPAEDAIVAPIAQERPRITPNFGVSGRFRLVDGTTSRFGTWRRYGSTFPILWVPDATYFIVDRQNATTLSGATDVSTFQYNDLLGLVIAPGQPIPQNVIDAEDDLSSGAVYPADYQTPDTMELSWSDRQIHFRVNNYTLTSSRMDIAPILSSDQRMAIENLNTAYDGTSEVSFKALPVFYGHEGMAEGPFVLRRLYARRDDSQVESVDYSLDDEGNTVAEVKRTTDFIARRDARPPIAALLSEYNIWDGSRPIWRVETIEHLDRARFVRLRCVEFVVV